VISEQASPPINDSLIELDETDPQRRKPFYMAKTWVRWLQEWLISQLSASVQINKTTTLETQAAAIVTSSAFLTVGPGLFRISYMVLVTQPASVSSSFQVTLGWVRHGVSQTFVGTLQNGNLVTTYETNTKLIRVDGLTDITYAIAYASVGTPMQYEADVIVEQLA
jgi:hypothetical protein